MPLVFLCSDLNSHTISKSIDGWNEENNIILNSHHIFCVSKYLKQFPQESYPMNVLLSRTLHKYK